MRKRIRLLAPAEQEMFNAALFYDRQAIGLGADFLDSVELALKQIIDAPERWLLATATIRRFILNRFPYSLLYQIETEEIIVLAVMHQKRHPAYWLPRINRN